MNIASKRKRDGENEAKKPKALFGEKEREAITQSADWPMYKHPDGGTVKITPWGSLRQWADPYTGMTCTRFEDVSFLDMSFEKSYDQGSTNYELPSTPMSLNAPSSARSSPTPGDGYQLSPSTEAELYVIEGYNGTIHQQPNAPHQNQCHQPHPFMQEHENYLGMDDNEEFTDDTTMS